MPATTKSSGTGMEQALPEPPRQNQPCQKLDFRLLASRMVGIHFCCFKPPSGNLWSFVTPVLGNRYSYFLGCLSCVLQFYFLMIIPPPSFQKQLPCNTSQNSLQDIIPLNPHKPFRNQHVLGRQKLRNIKWPACLKLVK